MTSHNPTSHNPTSHNPASHNPPVPPPYFQWLSWPYLKAWAMDAVLITVALALTCSWNVSDLLQQPPHDNPSPFAEIHLRSSHEFLALREDALTFALTTYAIQVPPSVQHIAYDDTLTDRGVLTAERFGIKRTIAIGRPAYLSWAVLGSSLAHESEVHGTQSLFAIWLSDQLGLDGTSVAEKHAYFHEIFHHARFGLTASEVASIQHTFDFFYGLATPPQKSHESAHNHL